ncbi:phosphoribosylamine--glycine ligase [Natronospora cellulosivora (SeqCode)]
MKVLLVGNGGREHALAWKIAQSEKVEKLYIAPGNAGTALMGENVEISLLDIDALLVFVEKNKIDLTVVGPEAPLVEGLVDRFEEAGHRIFGVNKEAAQLEGSKVFSKNLMKKYNIPTAEYETFFDAEKAIAYIKEKGAPIVVKAEGLAAGKGVIVAQETSEAIEAVNEILVNEQFGQAGNRIVVEEFLEGEEATILSFVDGDTIVPMIPSQDHKAAYDGDQGPNTGGMGAYAPAPLVDNALMDEVYNKILKPTIDALKSEGISYKGILYTGLMIKDRETKVLEYNVRFGDPETQVVLPLLKTDLIEIIEAVIDGKLDKIDIEWYDKKALCVIMASGGYPLEYQKGKEISGIEAAEEIDNLIVFQAGTELKDGSLLTAGGRVLAATALADDFESCFQKAYQAVELIKFNKAHYRRDIAHRVLKNTIKKNVLTQEG